ncbi:hypothetical protein J437_LFUL001354 [Ladona fulva]|uniref:Uncharacterized protein n=1 Tax=Ladona fulva TaxID=123851 RepID=A0A8K0JW83_LADFU|nr:hypothetical protein J437_LFUL001354 [Ladona fulva]
MPTSDAKKEVVKGMYVQIEEEGNGKGQRFKTSIKNCKTPPGANTDTDHNLFLVNLRTKQKHMKRKRGNNNWDLKP